MSCTCFIVPSDVLERLAADPELAANLRRTASETATISDQIRKVRDEANALTGVTMALGLAPAAVALAPVVTVFDCKHQQTLPGTPVPNPGGAAFVIRTGNWPTSRFC
jgi:hypothetical protein